MKKSYAEREKMNPVRGRGRGHGKVLSSLVPEDKLVI